MFSYPTVHTQQSSVPNGVAEHNVTVARALTKLMGAFVTFWDNDAGSNIHLLANPEQPTTVCALFAKMLMTRATTASSNVQNWEKGTPTLFCYVSKPRMMVLSLRNSQRLPFVTLDISLMSYTPAFRIRLRLGPTIFKEEKHIGQINVTDARTPGLGHCHGLPYY